MPQIVQKKNKKNLYLGDPNLKAAGVDIEWTTEDLAEYKKCLADPVYFIENYMKIVHIDKGVVPFDMYDYQKRVIELYNKNRFVTLKFPRQSGKDLVYGTPIITPEGFINIEDLEVGSTVFGADGKPTTVTAVFDFTDKDDIYELEFDTGEKIRCSSTHLWKVCWDNKKDCEVLETKDIISLKKNHFVYIPITEPIQFEEKQLAPDPYLMGVWIGEATLYQSIGSFFASDDYLLTSVDHRVQLLQGIMDMNGYVGEGGECCCLYHHIPEVIEKIGFLLSSLGIKWKRRPEGLCFSTNKYRIFSVEDKYRKQSEDPKKSRHYITSIVKVPGKFNTRCLTVDNEDHLFLCGKTMVPTHNTITTVGYLLHYILFNNHKNVGILANRAKTARGILSKLKSSYRQLPFFLQSGVLEWNKGSIELENGCSVFADATSESASRSESISLLILDEFAFVENNKAEEFMKSVYPTISSGKDSKVFVFSTPNSYNHFYKLWTDAKEGRNNYIPYEIRWDEVPGRDESFKEETIANIGEIAWNQEFEGSFLGSAGSLISSPVLGRMVYQNPIVDEDNLRIYKAPEPEHTYVLTVDPSEGLGQDSSAIVVTDVSQIPYEQVAVYQSNSIDPHLFPDVIVSLATKYNEAFVLLENNNVGSLVAEILHHVLEYENLLQTESAGRNGQRLTGGFAGKSRIGIRTSPQSKRVGCSVCKTIVESDQYIVNDFNTIAEFTTFCLKGKSYEAQEGYNDDLVMCIVLFAWLVNQQYFKDMVKNADIRLKISNSNEIDRITESLVPFGHYDNGLSQPHIVDDNTPTHLKNGAIWY